MEFHKLKPESETLNILFIAAEADPLIKVGGLGDVAGSLPRAIANLSDTEIYPRKVDIRLAIPYYPQLRNQNIPTQPVTAFEIKSRNGSVKVEVFSTNVMGITTYLVSGEPIQRSTAVYGSDFKSDAEKFVFFSLACLELPHALGWNIDILHANDWHTAVAVHMLHSTKRKPDELKHTRSIITLHNLPFMGSGAEDWLSRYYVKPSTNKHLPEWGRELPLPMGLAAADRIVAVSPTYAREILTPACGCDLQDFLETRRQNISGIINGIDSHSWDPATDASLYAKYAAASIKRKAKNKTALQKEFGLDQDPNVPLLILVSRMDPQKGVDIAVEGLRLIRDIPWQAILLGTGIPRLEVACRDLEEELPRKVRAVMKFDSNLSRRMYAGGDILLMPSRYEPCGISQMIAMRYGCIPVASATGGLVDTIRDEVNSENSTGFLFKYIEPVSFSQTLLRAVDSYKNKKCWNQMIKTAMTQDFSWQRSALQYIQLYSSISHP